MAMSESRKKANRKYDAKTYDQIKLNIRKDSPFNRDAIHAHAAMMGESFNSFVTRAVEETIERDKINRL